MTEHSYDECEKCAEHKAWEERMKLLDNIPIILTWINQSKGGLRVLYWFCGIGIPFIIAGVIGVRSELTGRIDKHEEYVQRKQELMSMEVASISKSAIKISGDVQTLVETSRLINIAHDREMASLQERIASLNEGRSSKSN